MWFAFQIAVAMAVFAVVYPGNADLGAAPAIVAMFAAFVATGLLARLIDWFRFSRGAGLNREPGSKQTSLIGLDGHSGDSPQPPSGRRISQDVSKLI